MDTFLQRHQNQIQGVISCFDRIIITGTFPDICYPSVLASLLYSKKIRLFDYPRWAEPYREEIRENAERVARENQIEIEFIKKNEFRKEKRIREIVKKRGEEPGLVHIFSAMERCASFQPWHDKKTGKTYLKPTESKCLHYYFYFIDKHLGLCYLRVPTWAPFRLQFYFNGHNALASKLNQQGIDYMFLDNSLVNITDYDRAQQFADHLQIDILHRRLDQYARQYCPVIRHFPSGCHWSLMQAEYATDVVFKRQEDLKPLYEEISRQAVLVVKAAMIFIPGLKEHGLSIIWGRPPSRCMTSTVLFFALKQRLMTSPFLNTTGR